MSTEHRRGGWPGQSQPHDHRQSYPQHPQPPQPPPYFHSNPPGAQPPPAQPPPTQQPPSAYPSQQYQQSPSHSQAPPPHPHPPHPQAQAPPAPYPPAPQYPIQQLPPIQPAATYAPSPATTSEQQHKLPPLPTSQQQSQHPSRQPSAPPTQDQQREGGPQYHTDYNRSGHATPAPVNRTYSHDSGQQRTPATPTAPPPFPPAGHDGAQYQAPPPPGPVGPPPPMDHGPHQGYPPPNGVPHGMPTHAQQHHDPHAPYMTPAMDPQHVPYPPTGQPMYSAPSYGHGPATGTHYGPTTKRKQMRATQACEQCRQRKQKCDEGSPCSFCKENQLTCNYRDTPPAKTDKNMERLLSYMETHNKNLERLTAQVEQFDHRLRKVEENTQGSQSYVQSPSTYRNYANHTEQSLAGAEQNRKPPNAPAPLPPDMDDHRTAPHKLLLLWPSVRPLLAHAKVEHNDSYVMDAEDRGILRIHARGEGVDTHDGTQEGGSSSPAPSEGSGEVNAAAPLPEGLWGVGPMSTPGSDTKRSEPCGTAGGLKTNGELDLDAATVNSLYDSYMKHIHIMHPFLDRMRVRRMLDEFIKKHSTGRPRATFAVGNDYSERPLKRQRSNGSSANNVGGSGSDSDVRREPTERSPGNAIIYLVLAMGKICMHDKPLPGIVHDSKLQANAAMYHKISAYRGRAAQSPTAANIKQSPVSTHATPMSQSHPTPPEEISHQPDARSRRASVEGSPATTAGPRNMDVIPGIAYYAKAAEIMGDQGDGNDLVHAQMFLLAGLYKGQLARVKESMSWLTMAGRAIQSLLDRYKLYNNQYWSNYSDAPLRRDDELKDNWREAQGRITDTRQSLIVLAAWTCLQLESDILAELRLPSSQIQSKEDLLLMPHKVSEEESYDQLNPIDGRQDNYENILLFYSAQIFLRRRLNEVHRQMYGKETLHKSREEIVGMLKGIETTVQGWRRGLPPIMKWEDDAALPTDILSARLRAKYWGARYVINRPFLDYALHIDGQVKEGNTVRRAAVDGRGSPRDEADVKLFEAISTMSDSEIYTNAQKCIHAAQHSTVAFDGIKGRLIVTNIHGTAHAQFGNMLVLCAVYKSAMAGFIDESKLRRLLERTIRFLRRLAPISPTCTADCSILEKFRNFLFPTDPDLPDLYKDEGVEAMSMSGSNGTASFASSA